MTTGPEHAWRNLETAQLETGGNSQAIAISRRFQACDRSPADVSPPRGAATRMDGELAASYSGCDAAPRLRVCCLAQN